MTLPLYRYILLLSVIINFYVIVSSETFNVKPDNTVRHEVATLGGGCFWCTEAIFEIIPGIINVESGYSGGNVPNPTYRQVKSGKSGHAEVIKLTFDSSIVSFEEVLTSFFYAHDPTSLNRQGVDVGHQYRSVVFYHNEEQRRTAEKVVRTFEANKVYKDPIVTEVTPFTIYYPAEDYHQDYFNTFKENQYCTIDTADIAYKIEKFFANYEQRKNNSTLVTHATPEGNFEILESQPKYPVQIKVVKSINTFHPWHNISYGSEAPEVVQALIEIQQGSRAKYEVDKTTGYLALDRVLHPSFPYPINYGFIPQTLYGDSDGLDVGVVSSINLEPLTLVQVRVIGMFSMVDNGEKDDKIITVVDKDPTLSHIKDIKDLEPGVINGLKEYYENYKKSESIEVLVRNIQGKEAAYQAIKAGIQLYRDVYVFSQE